MSDNTKATAILNFPERAETVCLCGRLLIVGRDEKNEHTLLMHALPYCNAFIKDRPGWQYLAEVNAFYGRKASG
jgi:hypothetical protein